MATSIYLYETIADYMKLYPKGIPMSEETPILAIFMYRPKGIWVVVDVEKKVGPVSKSHSLNVILNGMRGFEKFKDIADDFEEIHKIEYFYKENQVVFRLEDQVKKFTVDKYVGEKISRGRIKDWTDPKVEVTSYRFFDVTRNRMNFILKPYEQD